MLGTTYGSATTRILGSMNTRAPGFFVHVEKLPALEVHSVTRRARPSESVKFLVAYALWALHFSMRACAVLSVTSSFRREFPARQTRETAEPTLCDGT